MRRSPAHALLSALLAAPTAGAAAAPATPTTPELAPLLAKADAAYDRRDQTGALDEVRATLAQAEQLAPQDYEVLWRLARLEFWLADDPSLPDKERSRLGRLAWEYGDRATKADPSRVEGWNYAAAGMGEYALGIGVFQALREGIEGKFKERLAKAEAIDPDYSHGAIQTAWGRFWFKLPWPKYDGKKAEEALRAALAKNPDNVRAHVYLADVYFKEHHGGRAKSELKEALTDPPGRYDAPEERRMQEVAKEELAHAG